MKRRKLMLATLGYAAWVCGAMAQSPAYRHARRRLAIAIGGAENRENMERVAVLERSLAALGWRKNDNLDVDVRWSNADPTTMARHARDIAVAKPDLVLAASTPMVSALRREAPALPVVFVNVSDPVGSGFVASFARPGGNVTGFTDIEPSLASKWIEFLKAAVPSVRRVALLFNPDTAPNRGRFFLEPFGAAATALQVSAEALPVHGIGDIEQALGGLARQSGSALAVQPETFTGSHVEEIVTAAARRRLPAIYPYRFFCAKGGLMSYGVDSMDLYRRAASYIDRILKGASPQDLPTQAPAKFELVINRSTARALGITIPPTLLAQADDAIE